MCTDTVRGLIVVWRVNVGAVVSELTNATSDKFSQTYGMALVLDQITVVEKIPLYKIINFFFNAHIAHGKLPLAFRVLKLMGDQRGEFQAVSLKDKGVPEKLSRNKGYLKTSPTCPPTYDDRGQSPAMVVIGNITRDKTELLDMLTVDRDSVITIKVSTTSMIYHNPMAVGLDGFILLNMIDTPRHTDFRSGVT